MSHVFKLKQQNNGLKSLSLAYYNVSSCIVSMFFSVIVYWTSIVVFLYCFSLDIQCRTGAGVLNRLRCIDRFWQLYEVSLSSDNVSVHAVMLHHIIVNWTAMIVADIHQISMDVQ